MEKSNNKIKYISDLAFLVLICFISSFGLISMMRIPKENSSIENRTLTQFEMFQIQKFINGEFQNNFEDALSDQFVGGETIKKIMNNYTNNINALNSSEKICKNNYVSVGNGFYTYNCDNYLINGPEKIELENNDYINFRINELNKINKDMDVYYYIVSRSLDIDFRKNEYVTNIYSYLTKTLKDYKKIDYLKINSYDEYKKYFYKTDHHWNYNGSYQGYLDIVKMFKIENAMVPEKLLEFNDTIFYGSTARKLSFYDIKEPFKAYKFNYAEHEEYINGKQEKYGNYHKYYNGNYIRSTLNAYYGDFYGNDYAEVKYDYQNQSKENLLILSNSYSNPINPLIASHFNKTYIVDLRYYNNFNIYEYIEENEIDKVLFIADIKFLSQNEFELGV